jgi:hypothetical protein
MDRIERYRIEDLQNIPSKKVFTNFGEGDIDLVELHVYGGDTLLESDYDVDGFRIDKYIKKGRKRKKPRIELDIHNDIRQLGFSSGLYKVHYNFFRDILGSYNENNGIHISEISPSRKEIRIKTTSQDEEFVRKFSELQQKNVEDFIDEGWQDLLANFGNNQTSLIVNWKDDGDDGILIKLYEPLPDDVQIKEQLWVVKEIITSHTEMIKLIPAEREKVGNEIAGPNFTIDITKGTGGETDWHTWDTILGTNPTTKQKLMNLYTSGSAYNSAHLNIDYHGYNNFVHFSSAKERLENFKYKLGLIEYYDSQLATLNAITNTGTVNNKNISDYKIKKESVVQGFDGYENYLYFQSSSYESTSNGIRHERTWPKTNDTEPYSNRTITDPISVAWFTSQSNVALDYDVHNPHNLENTIPFHVREANDGKDNANYLLFVNMVAHHFDTVYNYIDHSMQIHKRTNPLYEDLSKDLVYNVLSSFGWESYQGFQFTDLWEYSFGQNQDGTFANSTQPIGTVNTGSVRYVTGSSAQSKQLSSQEDVSRETWKRMLNNLPYLMKTKGGERGIRALTTTYGLPPTLLRVFEYGGPQKAKTTDSYVSYDKFSYALEFGEAGSSDSSFRVFNTDLRAPHPLQTATAADRKSDALEFRFNTNIIKSQSLFTGVASLDGVTATAYNNQMSIIPHPNAKKETSGYYKYGKLLLTDRSNASTTNFTSVVSASTEWLPLFDNDWWNVMVYRKVNNASQLPIPFAGPDQVLGVVVAKSPDHSKARITHTGSAELALGSTEIATWESNKYFGFGSNWSNNALTAGVTASFSGSLQEVRLWYIEPTNLSFERWDPTHISHNATSSRPAPFWNHVRAPLSIEGSNATSSFAQLSVRHSLGADLNRANANYFQDGDWTSGNVYMTSSAPGNFHVYADNNIGSAIDTRHHPIGTPSAVETVAMASGFSGIMANDWSTQEERHYTPMPDLVSTRTISDKVRIESSELKGRLSDRNKVEKSQYDKAPLDSNRLGVYFAPHFEIDLDIAHEMAGADFHDYVGNPLDYRDDEYKRLRNLRNHYWKKHTNPYNFFEYLRILRFIDHSLFKQIEMLVPARANAQIGLLVKANMLEKPKVENLQEYVEENHHNGVLDISKYKVTANTTTLGGEYHKWFNPKSNKWEPGEALQAHTGYQAIYSGSSIEYTNQSTGEVEVEINTRKHHNHDLDIDGSRYYWDNMHWFQPSSSQGGPQYKNNPTASVIQGGASYENAGDFLLNVGSTTAEGFYGLDIIGHSHSSESSFTIANWKESGSAFDHPHYGHSQRSTTVAKFNDRGNIKYYHHQRASRRYKVYEYHFFSPRNNMATSASTGNNFPATNVSMSGYAYSELQGGFFRSGLRPVSKSLKTAEHQDYLPNAINNLLYAGCKLVGSDFNMPVTATVDGGPVVEVTDTNPNQLVISTPSAGNSSIQAVNISNAVR